MKGTRKKRIAVLRGGPSSEHHFSLSSGKNVLEHLDRELYIPIDIYIDKKAQWHEEGVPVHPYTSLQFVDGVFNALHGEYGEDGTVQTIIDNARKPHTGASVFSSRVAIDKHTTKLLLQKSGIKTPRGSIIRPSTKDSHKHLAELWRTLQHPLIVKPNASGSSVGMSIVRDFHGLLAAVEFITKTGHSALVEEFIEGQEVSVSIISDYRGEKLYAAIPSHVRHSAVYFDNITKKTNSFHVAPMKHFSSTERELVIRTAKHIHRELGLGQYSRTDFIVSKNGIYFLEVNTLPGLTPHSIFVKALEESGITFSDFLTHIVEDSIQKKYER